MFLPADRAPDVGDPPAPTPRARSRRFAGRVFWLLTGNVAYALSQWLVVVCLARVGSAEMVGQYTLGLAIATPIVLLAGLALRTVLVTDARSRHRFVDYLRLRIACMLAACVAIGTVALLVGADATPVIILVGVVKAVDGVTDICYALLQRQDRMRSIGVSMTMNAALTLLLVGVILAVGGDLAWAVTGSVAASVLTGVGYCAWRYRVDRRTDPQPRPPSAVADLDGVPRAAPGRSMALPRLALLAAPAGLASSLTAFAAGVPRYAVEATLGTTQLGVFAALAFLAVAANTATGAVAQALLPTMARLWTAGHRDRVRTTTWWLVAAAVGVGVVAVPMAVAFGGDVVSAVYGPGYPAPAGVLALLAAATALQSAVYFLDTALLAMRRFGTELVAALVAVPAVTAAALLVAPFGLTGAAGAVVVAATTQFLHKSVLVRRALRARPDRDRTAYPAVAGDDEERPTWNPRHVSASTPSGVR